MKGWLVGVGIELFALAIALALYYFGYVGWAAMPVALFIPPLLAALLVIASIASASRNGGNPFQ